MAVMEFDKSIPITSKFRFTNKFTFIKLQNVIIYIKRFCIRSYMFRYTWTILRELTLNLAKVTLL
jgi:hypothetical protein